MAEIPLEDFLKAYAMRRAEKSGLSLSDDDLKAVASMNSRSDVGNYLSNMTVKPKAKPKKARQRKSSKSESDEKNESESNE